jgi:hypothetical protein
MTSDERAELAYSAPRLVAVVEPGADEPAARVVAWCLEFDDSAQVVSEDGSLRMDLDGLDSVRRLFRDAELVWV